MLMDEPDVVERLGWTCEECGPGMSARDLDVCVLGNDVVALFPSITSKNTGGIVRKRVEKKPSKNRGFQLQEKG